MGTRSRIGMELPDHRVMSVYCHWDGYPEHNGRILVKDYQNRDDVRKLIEGGGMSSLRSDSDWEGNKIDPRPLYYTERGEKVEILYSSFYEFAAGHSWEEYAYIYDLEGNWKCYRPGSLPRVSVEIPS